MKKELEKRKWEENERKKQGNKKWDIGEAQQKEKQLEHFPDKPKQK